MHKRTSTEFSNVKQRTRLFMTECTSLHQLRQRARLARLTETRGAPRSPVAMQ